MKREQTMLKKEQEAYYLADFLSGFAFDINYSAIKPDVSDETALDFYQKCKSLLFDSYLDSLALAQLKRDHFVVIGKTIVMVSDIYQQKFRQMQQEIQEERRHFEKTNQQLKERLQISLEDNQFFKEQITTLELKQMQTQSQLNESLGNFGRQKNEFDLQIRKKEEIQQLSLKFCQKSQFLEEALQKSQQDKENLKRSLAQIQNQTQRLKRQNLDLKREIINLEKNLAEMKGRTYYIEQAYSELQKRFQQKAELYNGFVEAYNKSHHFQPYHSKDFSIGENSQERKDQLQRSHQLKGLSFYLSNSEERVSKESSLHSMSVSNKLAIIDYDDCDHADSKTVKSIISKSGHKVEVQQKQKYLERNLFKRQQKSVGKLSSFKKANQLEKQNYMSLTKKSPELSPASKRKASFIKSFKSSYSSKNQLIETMKQELSLKGQIIHRLELQLVDFRSLCMQLRSKMTMMEGQYELQVEDLRDRLTITEQELKGLYQQYCSKKALCNSYQQTIAELQEQLSNAYNEYNFYCDVIKNKCKEYLLNLIETLEYELQYTLVILQRQKKPNLQLQAQEGSDSIHRQSCQSEDDAPDEIGPITLDFDTAANNQESNPNSEIYQCSGFQIHSEQNEIDQIGQNIKRGNFTDRESTVYSIFDLKLTEKAKSRAYLHLKIQNQVHSFSLISETLSNTLHSKDMLQVTNQINQMLVLRRNRNFNVFRSFTFTVQPQAKDDQSNEQYYAQQILKKKQNKNKACSLVNISEEYRPKHRHSIVKTLSFSEIPAKKIQFGLFSTLAIELDPFLKITKDQMNSVKENFAQTDISYSPDSSIANSPNRSNSNASFLQRMALQLLRVRDSLENNNSYTSDFHQQVQSKLQKPFLKIQTTVTLQIPGKLQTNNEKEDNLEQQKEAYSVGATFEGFHISQQYKQAPILSDSLYNQNNEDEIQKAIATIERSNQLQLQSLQPDISDKIGHRSQDEQFYMSADKNRNIKARESVEFPPQMHSNIKQEQTEIQQFIAHLRTMDQQEDTSPNYQPFYPFISNQQPFQAANHRKLDSYTLNLKQNQEPNRQTLKNEDMPDTSKRNYLQTTAQGKQIENESKPQNYDMQVAEKVFQPSVSELKEEEYTNQALNIISSQVERIKRVQKISISLIDSWNKEQGPFRRPGTLDSLLIFMIGNKREAARSEAFLLSHRCLMNLSAVTKLQFGLATRKYITQYNFSIGQAEVILTTRGNLQISRKHKIQKTKGNQEDGIWSIEAMFVYEISK